jgi:hypothetical protein
MITLLGAQWRRGTLRLSCLLLLLSCPSRSCRSLHSTARENCTVVCCALGPTATHSCLMLGFSDWRVSRRREMPCTVNGFAQRFVRRPCLTHGEATHIRLNEEHTILA